MNEVERQDRFVGCLLGLAVGDALGSHFEGQSPDWIRNRYPTPESLIDNPPEAPWYYTDDTQKAELRFEVSETTPFELTRMLIVGLILYLEEPPEQ